MASDRDSRLGAMQAAMMGFGAVRSSAPGQTPQTRAPTPQRQASPAALIAALRKGLAAERTARLEAEARVRSLMNEVAKMQRQAVSRPALLQSSIEMAPEATTAAPIDAEVIEVEDGDVASAIRGYLTDGDDEEEDYDG